MLPSSPIYGYLEKPSMVDYPRKLAAVFFVSGCNFSCGFCHNAGLIGERQAGLSWSELADACRAFRSQWINGIVISGGEPTCSADLPELITFFKEQLGMPVKLDTNGSNPERLAACLPLVDYVAMDIKCGSSAYAEVTGYKDTSRIRESIKLIQGSGCDYEFRTTVIEELHSDDQMREIQELVRGSRRYALQAFIPREDLPGEEFRRLPRTRSSRLHEIRNMMAGCADKILVRGS